MKNRTDLVVLISSYYSTLWTLTQKEVAELIGKAANRSCPLAPMLTLVIFQIADELLPGITSTINMSFDSGEFSEAWRKAHVLPFLKKHVLDIEYKNFRPVSKLTYNF